LGDEESKDKDNSEVPKEKDKNEELRGKDIRDFFYFESTVKSEQEVIYVYV